jgi:hypothetical protein
VLVAQALPRLLPITATIRFSAASLQLVVGVKFWSVEVGVVAAAGQELYLALLVRLVRGILAEARYQTLAAEAVGQEQWALQVLTRHVATVVLV